MGPGPLAQGGDFALHCLRERNGTRDIAKKILVGQIALIFKRVVQTIDDDLLNFGPTKAFRGNG
jgi:hypothetical protein